MTNAPRKLVASLFGSSNYCEKASSKLDLADIGLCVLNSEADAPGSFLHDHPCVSRAEPLAWDHPLCAIVSEQGYQVCC
jgi:hypothetical protein